MEVFMHWLKYTFVKIRQSEFLFLHLIGNCIMLMPAVSWASPAVVSRCIAILKRYLLR